VNELNKPLGLTSSKKPKRRSFPFLLVGVAGLAVAAAAVGWFTFPRLTGPTVTASIDSRDGDSTIAPERTGATVPSGLSGLSEPAPEDGLIELAPTGSLSELDRVVIHDPADAPSVELAALPDSSLVEDSEDGLLPRISDDGLRPLDAYARPSNADPADPRIAIVVGGIGIDPAGTKAAIATLPGSVTLAFAPYGEDLDGAVAAARGSGHEILLQIPLEPYNYPATDPGPNTLTVKAEPAENLARLRWFLGRLTNYVGVVNYMGARFTSENAALAPVMEEIGGRGLLYLDDGSSARSKAAAVAGSAVPFLRADMVLDADLNAAAIDARLRQLQAIARERGYAVATATAFPVSIERIAAFVRAAEDRGIFIVPVSALVGQNS
jgi:polysaccharide deacetylase 2 family uncharacterized protein YibQ